MWINEDKRIHSHDSVLTGFTYQDIIDNAEANGESIFITYQTMLRECIDKANANLDACFSELKEINKEKR